jgi:hypothetical protein
MAREVRITVRGVPREQPDLRRLARALLEAAKAEQQRAAKPHASTDRQPAGEQEAAS